MGSPQRIRYIVTDHAIMRLRQRVDASTPTNILIERIMQGAYRASPEELWRVNGTALRNKCQLYINEAERCGVIVKPDGRNALRIVTVLKLVESKPSTSSA